MITFDASELDSWANDPGAPHQLPQLVRWLILATASPTLLDMPSGSSVRLPGWDGLLAIKGGNAWVPDGSSAWEFSCRKDSKRKASADYNSRTADPKGVDVAAATFLFVTPRRWAGKREWANERRQSGPWADVRALDADDLVAWLEQAPEVAGRIVPLIRKLPANGASLPGLMHQEATDIKRHIDLRFDALEAKRPPLATPGLVTAEPLESGTLSDPAHRELAKKVDFARDLIGRGLVRSASADLERLRKEAGSAPVELQFRIITNLGACALAEEDVGAARALFEDAHGLCPNDQKGISNAALAAHLGKDSERSVELALKVRRSDPQNSQATAILLEQFWQAGKIEKLEELVAAEEWIARDQQCSLALVGVRMEQSRFDEAITLCHALIETDSEDAYGHLVLGECLLNYAQAGGYSNESLSRLGDAATELTKAVELLQSTELKARYREALVARAAARALLGTTEEAMEGPSRGAPRGSDTP